MIPSEKIEVAHAADIVATARRYTTLKRAGTEWTGPCPKCGGKDRFGVNARKRIWNCRGCAKGGDTIALVQHAAGLSFAEAVAALVGENKGRNPTFVRPPPSQPNPAPDNGRVAFRIWNSALSIRGTLAEHYLAGRGIDIRRPIDIDIGRLIGIDIGQLIDVDDVLRFAPRCLFGDERLPCLIALVRNVLTNEPVAIQRTALDANGMKIGRLSLGPTKGGAIKLWADEAVTTGLCVGEGMETVASAALGITHKNTLLQPAWSLLDRGNLKDLPALPGIEALTILVDNDESGDGQADAEVCARRWIEAGRQVTRLTPRKPGSDFNDILRGAA